MRLQAPSSTRFKGEHFGQSPVGARAQGSSAPGAGRFHRGRCGGPGPCGFKIQEAAAGLAELEVLAGFDVRAFSAGDGDETTAADAVPDRGGASFPAGAHPVVVAEDCRGKQFAQGILSRLERGAPVRELGRGEEILDGVQIEQGS